mmetsp:Transcript_35502/g.87289  ORF Transcript_35502/g.87289 Transcript_35502/m.87289 type:complete len:306 (-) Transcript_35502:1156-2073(-)
MVPVSAHPIEPATQPEGPTAASEVVPPAAAAAPHAAAAAAAEGALGGAEAAAPGAVVEVLDHLLLVPAHGRRGVVDEAQRAVDRREELVVLAEERLAVQGCGAVRVRVLQLLAQVGLEGRERAAAQLVLLEEQARRVKPPEVRVRAVLPEDAPAARAVEESSRLGSLALGEEALLQLVYKVLVERRRVAEVLLAEVTGVEDSLLAEELLEGAEGVDVAVALHLGLLDRLLQVEVGEELGEARLLVGSAGVGCECLLLHQEKLRQVSRVHARPRLPRARPEELLRREPVGELAEHPRGDAREAQAL